MDNALENNNLEEGQVNDNVGQDEGGTQQESSTDWEQQAKYHQSEKDKLYAENQNLKKYEEIGQFLESRPDVVEGIKSMVSGQPNTAESLSMDKDEFDPWEAYNDPSSKSYKFRQQELQKSINDGVSQQMQGFQKQAGVNQLRAELSQKGLNPEEVESFMDFAAKNPAEYGVDGAINMWKAVVNPQATNNNPLDAVRQNQNAPQQAGILSGEQPERKGEKDEMWDAITKAGSRANVL
jgi:SOS response regulatory protein OraA/RecX